MNKVCMNVTTTMHSNLINDIKIAKEAGYAAIEIQHNKLYRYLDAGFTCESLLPILGDLKVSGVGALWNIERQGEEYEVFLQEVDRMCKCAQILGAPMVQMCTGPVFVDVVKDFYAGKIGPNETRYMGLLGRSEKEVLELTAKNVAAAADIAAKYGVDLFFEPLAWAPVKTIKQALEIIDMIKKPNVGVVIDFWHMWTTGETPDFVRTIDKNLIKQVHICDGLEYDRTQVPDQAVLRDVWTGEGNIPLKEYVEAVKATGYDGWWASEIFCTKAWEQDHLKTASTLKNFIDFLLL